MASIYIFNPSDPIVPGRGVAFRSSGWNKDTPHPTGIINPPPLPAKAQLTKWDGSNIVALSQAELDALAAARDAALEAKQRAWAKQAMTSFGAENIAYQAVLRFLVKEINKDRTVGNRITVADAVAGVRAEVDAIVKQ